jgi:hypothetical protein
MGDGFYRSLRLFMTASLALAVLFVRATPLAAGWNSPALVVAEVSEERLPAKELPGANVLGGTPSSQPSSNASPSSDSDASQPATIDSGESQPGGAADPEMDTDDQTVPEPMASDSTPTPSATSTLNAQSITPQSAGDVPVPTPGAEPTTPPPALDVSAIGPTADLGAESLESEIKRAGSPARVASMRLTEQARRELAQGAGDVAMRDLSHAVSIDPGNPFEYYYLGRVYLSRKNYAQALTFFQRAELGFAARPDWLGETLTYEGACEEELGHMPDAARAYQRAVASAPGNFRAAAGYGRLGANIVQPAALEAPPPLTTDAAGPPLAAPPAPAPDEEPAPPPNDPTR